MDLGSEKPSRRALAFVSCVTTMLSLAAGVCAAEREPVDIGARRELFVDHFLIDAMTGTSLRLHRPIDQGSVLAFDKPWEGPFCAYATVIHADNKYQLYYRGLAHSTADTDASQVTCYAESNDGITWVKPDLDLYPRGEHQTTNVVLADAAPVTHNFSPMLDTRAGVKPDQRYKAIGGYHDTGLVAYVSSDGIRWNKLRDEPVLTRTQAGYDETTKGWVFDSQNVAFWSEVEQKYLLYYRVYKDRMRRIARVESNDFLTWTNPTLMEYRRSGDASAPVEQLYTNQTHPYFRASQIYLAIPARFMPGRRVLTTQQAKAIRVNSKYFNDTSDAVFMTSRGGNTYQRTFMEAFVAPGIGAENWVSRTNYPALNVVQTAPTEMSVYVNQNYGQPTSHLRRYSLRLDGFASVHADYDGGEMRTRPLTFQGSELLLNFATSAAGGIKVEIQDERGAPIPGFALDDCQELIGNEIERSVSWSGGGLNALAGKVIRLRFVMKDADLYALRFGESHGDASSSGDPDRTQWMKILNEGLTARGSFVSIHAAEALLALGEPTPVVEAFRPQAQTAEPKYRIGVWRVLARAESDEPLRSRYVEHIRGVLLDADAPDRVHAIESLAKLDAPISSSGEREAVESIARDPAAGPFGLWRLAQAAESSARDRLEQYLVGDDEIGRARAKYVLERLDPPAALIIGTQARQAAAAAAPADRYAAAMKLADVGTAEDRGILERLASDPDLDVRVAAAFALLQLDQRAAAPAR